MGRTDAINLFIFVIYKDISSLSDLSTYLLKSPDDVICTSHA